MAEAGAGSFNHRNRQHDENNLLSKGTHRRNAESYLDALSKEVMENIIRFTSESPRSTSWDSYVSESVALQLTDSKSPFAASSCDMFRSVNITPDVVRGGLCVCSSNFGSRILSALRRSLTQVMVAPSKISAIWERALMTTFPNLKYLSLFMPDPGREFNLSKILEAQSENLKFLRIFKITLSANDVKAIEKFGARLEGLHLSMARSETEMDDMWKSVGSSLEDLSIPHPCTYVNIDIPSITRSCRKIRKLSLFVRVGEWHNVEALCKSLGKQLSLLTLDASSTDAPCLGRIAAACENAAIELKYGHACTPAAMLAVGANARHVEIGTSTVRIAGNTSETLRLAGERCKNLVGISLVHGIPQDSLEAFLSSPKPSLLEFNVQFARNLETQFVVEALTRNVSSLEVFEIQGRLPAVSVFRKFVCANPSLRTVRLIEERREYGCDHSGIVTADELTKVFLKCQKMQEISISCHRRMNHCGSRNEDCATASLSARYRNIAVTICGHLYT